MKKIVTIMMFMLLFVMNELWALNESQSLKIENNASPIRTTETILSEGFEGAFPSGSWTVIGFQRGTTKLFTGPDLGQAWCADTSLNPSGGAYSNNMNAQMKYGPSLSGPPVFNKLLD